MEFENIIGFNEFPTYVINPILLRKMPQEVKNCLSNSIYKSYKKKNWKELREFLIDLDKDIHHPDPALVEDDYYGSLDKIKTQHRREVEKCTQMERELQELREREKLHLDFQKKHAVDGTFDRKPKGSGVRGATICWNCWERDHTAPDCPHERHGWDQREQLRITKQVEAPKGYQEAPNRWMTTKTIQKRDLSDGDKANPESLFNFNMGCAQVQGTYPIAGRKRYEFDTVHPDPELLQEPDWDSEVWIKGVKAPIPLISLLKNSSKYCQQIRELLFQDKEEEPRKSVNSDEDDHNSDSESDIETPEPPWYPHRNRQSM